MEGDGLCCYHDTSIRQVCVMQASAGEAFKLHAARHRLRERGVSPEAASAAQPAGPAASASCTARTAHAKPLCPREGWQVLHLAGSSLNNFLEIKVDNCLAMAAFLSKRRYALIKEWIQELLGEGEASQALARFMEIMNYDPDRSTYTPAQAKHIMAWRQRKMQETRLSMYVIGGAKAAFENRKRAAVG